MLNQQLQRARNSSIAQLDLRCLTVFVLLVRNNFMNRRLMTKSSDLRPAFWGEMFRDRVIKSANISFKELELLCVIALLHWGRGVVYSSHHLLKSRTAAGRNHERKRRVVGCLFTRYSRLSNRLYNRFDNRVERTATIRSTGCQTGCQTGLTAGLTTGCIV